MDNPNVSVVQTRIISSTVNLTGLVEPQKLVEDQSRRRQTLTLPPLELELVWFLVKSDQKKPV